MMSWSVPMSVDSHLRRRSKKGDGCNKVEATDDKGVFAAVIDGGIGALDESAVADIADGGRQGEGD